LGFPVGLRGQVELDRMNLWDRFRYWLIVDFDIWKKWGGYK